MRLLVLLALGCSPANAVLVDDFGPEPERPADTDDPNDTDPPDDTGDPDPPDPELLPPAPLVWVGEREIRFDFCTDTIRGRGDEVTLREDYAGLVAACPCDRVFVVESVEETICDGAVTVARIGVRGLTQREDGRVEVVWALIRGGAVEGWEVRDEDATWDGTVLEYSYDATYGDESYSVTGSVELVVPE